ncbi:MAG TPA: serine/threonine-protein kinase, partial [Candidatus Limnocylindrales bacterium]|nr:serine/threonine-protein kinase [Candidatus Limnocylindrales bacterium]
MPTIGDRLAERYRLDARIGSGGFATVFRAHDLRLDRDVAIKVLLANLASDPVVTARFEREARTLAAINHPNVVAIHDVASGDPDAGSEPYFVMDLCAGGSLADLLNASPTGSLPADILIPILIDVSAGLAALHAAGIIHRDLKPSNVLLSGGRAQIADLGIASAGPSDLTATGTAVGTLAYLAPEQLRGAPASPASDVHALGAITFLGLTGRLPSPGDSV